jgi:hypothetical protein
MSQYIIIIIIIIIILLLLLLLLTAIELSLGGSSTYTSTDKIIKNKYTVIFRLTKIIFSAITFVSRNLR